MMPNGLVRVKCLATPDTEDVLNLLSGHICQDTNMKSDVQPCARPSEMRETAKKMNGRSVLLTAVLGQPESREMALKTIGWTPRTVPTVILFDEEGCRLWESNPVGRVDLAVLVGSNSLNFREKIEGLTAIGARYFNVTNDLPWPSLMYKMVAQAIVEYIVPHDPARNSILR